MFYFSTDVGGVDEEFGLVTMTDKDSDTWVYGRTRGGMLSLPINVIAVLPFLQCCGTFLGVSLSRDLFAHPEGCESIYVRQAQTSRISISD